MSELVDALMNEHLINRSGSKPYLQALEHLSTGRPMHTYGPKVQDFHDGILGDENVVVGDSHSACISMGWYKQAGSWGLPITAYRLIGSTHREAAKHLGIPPRAAQAGPWGWHKKYCKTKEVDLMAATYIEVQHMDNPKWKRNHGYYLTADIAAQFMTAHNVLYAWDQMTKEEQQAGFEWYERALEACIAASGRIGLPLEELVAVVALVSPGRNWNTNIEAAVKFIQISRELDLI